MSTKTPATIKAKTGFRRMTPEAVVSNATAVYSGLNGNANIPAPPAPFDLPTLLAATQALATANAAALDGGTKALAQRDREKDIVVDLLDNLATYARTNCKKDMTIFLSSGFKALTSPAKQAQPTTSQSIRWIKLGPGSGQMRGKLVTYPGAGSYELCWWSAPAGVAPGARTTQPVTNIRSAVIVSGLTPGTTYAFQARAVVNSAYTDFGDPVTQVAV
jgi:hypothetical protein